VNIPDFHAIFISILDDIAKHERIKIKKIERKKLIIFIGDI